MVEADIPDSPSEIRTTFSAPFLGAAGGHEAQHVLGVTSAGSLPMTPKKTLRSWA